MQQYLTLGDVQRVRGKEDDARRAGAVSDPFADVREFKGGFSLPVLKWRELLFVGALRQEGDGYVRDPTRPLPPFERPNLFPEGVSFTVRSRGERVEIVRIGSATDPK